MDWIPRLARLEFALLALGAFFVTGCAAIGENIFAKQAAPSYFTQVTPAGYLYAHNYPDRPCFTVELPGQGWRFLESTPDNVQWLRGGEVLRIYLTDNREARFAVAGMNSEQVLRSFVAYEIEYVQPWFDFHITATPRMAENFNGVWMQWGWEGHGGKRRAARVDEPADQRHVVHSLWLEPWVLSLDWATTDLTVEAGATPLKIDTLESVEVRDKCLTAMRSNRYGRTPDGRGPSSTAPPSTPAGPESQAVPKTSSSRGGYVRRSGTSRPSR